MRAVGRQPPPEEERCQVTAKCERQAVLQIPGPDQKQDDDGGKSDEIEELPEDAVLVHRLQGVEEAPVPIVVENRKLDVEGIGRQNDAEKKPQLPSGAIEQIGGKELLQPSGSHLNHVKKSAEHPLWKMLRLQSGMIRTEP